MYGWTFRLLKLTRNLRSHCSHDNPTI